MVYFLFDAISREALEDNKLGIKVKATPKRRCPIFLKNKNRNKILTFGCYTKNKL